MTEETLANSTMTFPQKLFILMESEHGGEIVQWSHHGFSFRILDSDRFSCEIVPKYFKRKLLDFRSLLFTYNIFTSFIILQKLD
jgi:hypothetical protein